MSNQHTPPRPFRWRPAFGCFALELTQACVALVDAEDIARVGRYNWSVTKTAHTAYALRRAGDGKPIYLHRFILSEASGLLPGIEIDHANGDGLDCRRSNLRTTTHQRNAQNRNATQKRTLSRFKGVTRRRNGRWAARCAGKHIGYFGEEMDAALAYDKAAREQFGRFACLNFPKPGEQGIRG